MRGSYNDEVQLQEPDQEVDEIVQHQQELIQLIKTFNRRPLVVDVTLRVPSLKLVLAQETTIK